MEILAVSERATLPAAPALRDALFAALDEHALVTLDLAAVVEADLAFLQLVEAGRREAAARDKHLALSAPATGAVHAALDRAGFLAAPDGEAITFWFHGELPQ